MYFSARVALPLVWLLAAGGNVAGAQTPAPSALPQAPPTLSPPNPVREQPAKPPAAAPRQPVHKSAQAAGPEKIGPDKTPVVPPHGSLHPHKPSAQSSAKAPVQSSPAPALPPQPPALTATAPAETADPEKPEGAEARLPRFAALRSDEVNMRAGPGTRYRIDWVYKRRELPVEIQREFDVWRWVRDADGIQGWVHQATLMGRRSFVVQNADATLRSESSDNAPAVAILKVGVIGRIRSCKAASDWCDVQAGSHRGYLRRGQFWGTLPGEAVNP